MRRTGKQKLCGQGGASLLLALLFTLAASMVSMVIISASSTAVKRMYDDTTRQQDYLTLESAAQPLKAALENTTYTYTVEEEEGIGSGYSPGDGFLAQTVCDALNRDDKKATFTLPKPTGGDWPFEDVEMEITMDEQAELSGVFYLTAEIHLDNSATQKLFLTATSKLIPGPSEPEAVEPLIYTYGFERVNLQTRLESVASGGGGA